MAPIRDAVGLVDDQEGDALCDLRQHLGAKVLVAEPLGSNQQDVRLVTPQAFFPRLPSALGCPR